MNEMRQSRSKELLNKVYDYLDTIDVSNLSMNEIKDFLEVVQKGQFLESFGQVPSLGFNNLCCAPQTKPVETTDGEKQ